MSIDIRMSPELEKCPRSLLVCEKSNFMNEKSRHDIHVSKHSFNYKVNLLNISFNIRIAVILQLKSDVFSVSTDLSTDT